MDVDELFVEVFNVVFPVLARKFPFATANWTTELLWESMHVLGVSYESLLSTRTFLGQKRI